MSKRFDLNAFRPKTLTTSFSVAGKDLITDRELYYHLNSCPFFHTYNDGEVGADETLMLPFFRRFLKYRNYGVKSFNGWLKVFDDYIMNKDITYTEEDYKKYIRYLTNFYSLLNPSKKFEVILPYFPYKFDYLSGCVEAIIKTKSGIRIYAYDFSNTNVEPEGMNFNGFRLQLAARVFFRLTDIQPVSLACVYPAFKAVVYYTYNHSENLEEMITDTKQFVRRYGLHCAYCLQRDCSPLLDYKDKYGFKASEK